MSTPDDARGALIRLRWAALAEGISYVALLGVGMPLKYVYGLRAATRILGSVHGLLTLVLIITLAGAAAECAWPRRRTLTLFGLSLLPFGVFFCDRALRRDITSLDRTGPRHSDHRPTA